VEINLRLRPEDLVTLIDALDAYEYWQLGDVLPRNNGEVFIPGDLPPDDDRYWGAVPKPDELQQEAIEQVKVCRALADELRLLLDETRNDA
jgi:hypothetical protein